MHGHKHRCVIRPRADQKVHQREAFPPPERQGVEESNCHNGKSIPLYSTPLASSTVHFGELLDNPVVSFYLHSCDSCNGMRIVCLAQ